MSVPSRVSSWMIVTSAACVLTAACCSAAGEEPPVRLVETRPVETTLGNPELPTAHDVWLEMIRGARRTLDLEEFYFSDWPGEPLHDVVDAIGEAAKRGVRVRLLLDARMHKTYPMPADSLGTLPGVTVRTIDFGKIAGGVQHAKYFLVDGRMVYLGSQNLDWRALKHIHELGVEVQDARVAGVFRQVFEMDWAAGDPVGGAAPDSAAKAAARRLAPLPGDAAPLRVPLRIVQSPGDTVALWPSYSPRGDIPDTTLWDRNAVVRLIDSARRQLVVQVLTYSPVAYHVEDRTIDDALRRAAARGVRVKMIVSDWEAGTREMRYLQELSSVPNVEAKLSTVPAWSGGYIPFARVEHLKYAVADSQRVWVGTANWEPGYFLNTRNLAVSIENRPIVLQALKIFAASWNAPGAAPVVADSTYKPKVHGETPPPGAVKYGE